LKNYFPSSAPIPYHITPRKIPFIPQYTCHGLP